MENAKAIMDPKQKKLIIQTQNRTDKIRKMHLKNPLPRCDYRSLNEIGIIPFKWKLKG